MLPRERVQAAIEFRPPDLLPLRILPAQGGLYEHGDKLLNLHRTCGHDFGDLSGLQMPQLPAPEDFDEDGRYHRFLTDEWGTRWEYRIFGVWGHPVCWPLDSIGDIDAYRPPDPPASTGPGVDQARADVKALKQTWFTLGNGGSIFEKMCSLRRFEDVLVEITQDTPQINRMADMIAGYSLGHVERSLATDVDGVCFGDDFGTQEALLLSPQAWRRFFKPRYRELFEPVRRAGKKVFFHCCGQVEALLEDFAQIGVDALWPQLTAFDMAHLARRCSELGMAVELHPDRGDLMQRGTPRQIGEYLYRLFDTFGTPDGGSWLYIEIDPGFPYANVEALFSVAMELRDQ